MIPNLFKKEFLREVRGTANKKIRDEGLFYFILFAFKKLALLFTVFLLYILIRLVRRIIFIRFGSLNAQKIGPLISLPGLYLYEKDHNVQPQNTLDIFCDGYGPICNNQLLKMWKRVFRTRKRTLLANGIAKHFSGLANRFSFGGEHIIKTKKHGRDVLGLIEKGDIYLSFNEDEVSQAKSDMGKMGIGENDSYVCILNRTPDYLEKTFPGRNWDYHKFRSCSINNYMLAADELTKRGHYVIRMGSVVGDLIKTDNIKIIEYAHKGYRTELLDIYLCANCYFFISCGSGLDAVPWFFQLPEVYVNVSSIEYCQTWLSNSIMIFKKYYLKKEKRFMLVSEMFKSGAGRFHRTEEYENMGLELIENTPEEILDVVDEMDQRLKGTWQTTEEDEELQKNFWSHFATSDLHGVIRSRIGAKFLRQSRELL